MELISDGARVIPFEDLNTTKLLEHARRQAVAGKYDDFLIVDVDSHHYETEHFGEILELVENPVLRQLSKASHARGRNSLIPQSVGFQDMGGRITRYMLRKSERTPKAKVRDVELGHRWMDAMGVDYTCLFPTGMLAMGLHPQPAMEVELCWAYNRWLTEKVLPESGGRMCAMLGLPFADADACLRNVEAFADRPGVVGFMIATVRGQPVHHNSYMKVYRAIEERRQVLSFHASVNWSEPVFKGFNNFLSVHALGFTFYNMVQLTSWVTNGLPERFPGLKVIWIESGLAWLPFMMQRLDHEYMLRPSEAPLLKRKPSEYMREMFYSSQPMEVQNLAALELTFKMINAETQLLYSSDYPHWDFDLPGTIYDLPFLDERAKQNILGGNAARLFKLAPRNAAQAANLARHAPA